VSPRRFRLGDGRVGRAFVPCVFLIQRQAGSIRQHVFILQARGSGTWRWGIACWPPPGEASAGTRGPGPADPQRGGLGVLGRPDSVCDPWRQPGRPLIAECWSGVAATAALRHNPCSRNAPGVRVLKLARGLCGLWGGDLLFAVTSGTWSVIALSRWTIGLHAWECAVPAAADPGAGELLPYRWIGNSRWARKAMGKRRSIRSLLIASASRCRRCSPAVAADSAASSARSSHAGQRPATYVASNGRSSGHRPAHPNQHSLGDCLVKPQGTDQGTNSRGALLPPNPARAPPRDPPREHLFVVGDGHAAMPDVPLAAGPDQQGAGHHGCWPRTGCAVPGHSPTPSRPWLCPLPATIKICQERFRWPRPGPGRSRRG